MSLSFWDSEHLVSLASRGLEQLIAQVEGLSAEELVDQRHQNLLIILIVNLTTKNGLGDQSA